MLQCSKIVRCLYIWYIVWTYLHSSNFLLHCLPTYCGEDSMYLWRSSPTSPKSLKHAKVASLKHQALHRSKNEKITTSFCLFDRFFLCFFFIVQEMKQTKTLWKWNWKREWFLVSLCFSFPNDFVSCWTDGDEASLWVVKNLHRVDAGHLVQSSLGGFFGFVFCNSKTFRREQFPRFFRNRKLIYKSIHGKLC